MLIFKNINEWSKHKVRLVACLFWLAYFALATITPIIIVSTKYSLLQSRYTALTIAGWCCLIVFGTIGVKAIQKLFKVLPEYTRGEQLFKALLKLVGALIIPVFVLIGIHLIRVNVETALDCIMWSTISIICAKVIECILLYPLEVQLDLISLKEKQNAIANVNA